METTPVICGNNPPYLWTQCPYLWTTLIFVDPTPIFMDTTPVFVETTPIFLVVDCLKNSIISTCWHLHKLIQLELIMTFPVDELHTHSKNTCFHDAQRGFVEGSFHDTQWGTVSHCPWNLNCNHVCFCFKTCGHLSTGVCVYKGYLLPGRY